MEEAEQQNVPESESMPPRSSPDADSDATIESAVRLVHSVFGNSSADDAPDILVSQLETTLDLKKDSWPISTIRRLTDALIEVTERRKQSPRHEMRWLNLSGFCSRPGLGVKGDDTRVKDLLTIVSNKLAFEDELQSQIQLLVLLRRIASGISASAQQALFRRQAGRLYRH